MSNGEIIKILKEIISNINDGIYTDDIKEEIIDATNHFVTGKQVPLDDNTLKYLIRGWWLTNYINDAKLECCPYCLRSIEN